MTIRANLLLVFIFLVELSAGAAHAAAAEGRFADNSLTAYRSQPIRWLDSKAARTAMRENARPLLVYVTSRHCGYCRKMERDTWAEGHVTAAVNAGFFPVRVNADAEPSLVESLGVQAYPTTMVFSPAGTHILTLTGYVPPERMIEAMHRASQVHAKGMKVSHEVRQTSN
jgi:thioredoxin-related protein